MLEELKQFTPSTRPAGKQLVSKTVTVEQLKEVFSQPLILLPITDASPLYCEGFEEQYELVHLDGDRVISYTVQTGNDDTAIDIAPFWREYLETGKITPPRSQGDTNIHLLPLPTYQVAEYQHTYMSCVLLKNNKRAMANRDTIIEGCEV